VLRPLLGPEEREPASLDPPQELRTKTAETPIVAAAAER
jgi:hypothetical protein